MASIYRDWRTPASILVAACLIVSAYLLARGASRAPIAEASTETALLKAIATKDSTGDGLPDWEKSLYGIPLNATSTDYFGLGMTDGEAVTKGLIVPVAPTPSAPTPESNASANTSPVPGASEGTITNAFAKNFFTLYVQAKEQANGTALTESQLSDISTRALAELSATLAPAPDYKVVADLKLEASGPDALKKFAAEAEAVMAAQHSQLPKSELQYLQDTLNGDASAITNIQALATAYENIATGLAVLPVPPELASADLAIINSMARIGAAAQDFARINTDPAATMLALQQYPQTVTAMTQAFQKVAQVYGSAGVSIPAGTPGASFVSVISDIQQSSAKP